MPTHNNTHAHLLRNVIEIICKLLKKTINIYAPGSLVCYIGSLEQWLFPLLKTRMQNCHFLAGSAITKCRISSCPLSLLQANCVFSSCHYRVITSGCHGDNVLFPVTLANPGGLDTALWKRHAVSYLDIMLYLQAIRRCSFLLLSFVVSS